VTEIISCVILITAKTENILTGIERGKREEKKMLAYHARETLMSIAIKSRVNSSSIAGLHIMALPPGPAYFLWLFPYFAIPSAAVYVPLRLLHVLTFSIPIWLVIAATLVARPTIFLFNFYVGTPWADKRGAVARGAILPPVVQESSMSIIPRLLESTRSGYPSTCYFSSSTLYIADSI